MWKASNAILLAAFLAASVDAQPAEIRWRAVEIDKIERRVNEKGLTIVPLSLYFKDGRAKVELALARGKHMYDKRETIKRRMDDRDSQRAMRRGKGRGRE